MNFDLHPSSGLLPVERGLSERVLSLLAPATQELALCHVAEQALGQPKSLSSATRGEPHPSGRANPTTPHGPRCFWQAAVVAIGLARAHRRVALPDRIMISSATATIMLENHADHVGRCVANEFGQFGICANSISPGRGVLATMKSFGGRGHVQAIRLSEFSKLSERKWHEQLHINIA